MADYVETGTYAVQKVTTLKPTITIGAVTAATADLYTVPE